MKENILTNKDFSSLPISDEILKGLEDANYNFCTPVQEQTLAFSLNGKNVAGQAQTGTGKTAAFLIATFQYLLNTENGKDRVPRAIILAPTRELAIQIHDEARVLGRHTDFRTGLVYGGTGYKQQLKTVSEGVDILIGTPGRLIDFFKQKIFTLKHIQVLVIDEADRMFDLGFIRDVRYMLRNMSKADRRLNLLFSATLSYRVTELAYEHMDNPEIIRIDPEQVTAKQIDQSVYCPSNDQKIPLMVGLLRKIEPFRTIIFVNTKRSTEKLYASLIANGFSAGLISGDVPQPKRQLLLQKFQEDKISIVIATDIAARGLHIPQVTLVFNFDLPGNVEDYVHRIGRTARLGEKGQAISFACEDYAYSLPEIEEYIGESLPVQTISEDLLPPIEKAKRQPPRKSSTSAKYRKGKPDQRRRRPPKNKSAAK